MEFLIYLLTAIVVFLGTFIGYMLSKHAFEELRDIVDYLKIANILIISAAVFFIFYQYSWITGAIASLIILGFLILFNKKYSSIITYAALGGIFYASSLNQNSFIIVSSLIFAYGIMLGTIYCAAHYQKNNINMKNHEKKLDDKKINNSLMKGFFKKHIYFILVALVFYLVFSVILTF